MSENNRFARYRRDWNEFWLVLDFLFLARGDDHRGPTGHQSGFREDRPEIDRLWTDITGDLRSDTAWDEITQLFEEEIKNEPGDSDSSDVRTTTAEYLLRELKLITTDLKERLSLEFIEQLGTEELHDFGYREVAYEVRHQQIHVEQFDEQIENVETFKESLEKYIGGRNKWLDRLLDLLNELIDLVS